ncbi:MAG: YgeY family selenium metabolism-linked hydrolase [Desulfobacteraceae bacterium]|nr:MAG: YgeY family selenium metabolism-linked hydrolase [Desulfobacteraceae bacterium]
MKELNAAVDHIHAELIGFAQELVRIKSYPGQEEEIVRHIKARMDALGYDEVTVDAMGNVVGRIGTGEQALMFDSHVDTVRVDDESVWDHPPFSGNIVDGRLYGRGSVDMKSAAAASVYAAATAKALGLVENKTVYVSCTVMEEDCDGENLKHLFKACGINPDYMIICEPSGNKLATGHKGKAQIKIKTHGVSAHGSAPEKGVNAIYEMARIVQRVEQVSNRLLADPDTAGTIVASDISSKSASLNAVPFECEIYLDRRLALGETRETVEKEMASIIAGTSATWEIGTLTRKSWTGMEIVYEPIHMPWQIDMAHPLSATCVAAYQKIFGTAPEQDYWDFSTNAVTTTAMGIPTIGFGPGEYKLAHMVNENCETSQIVDACRFYAALIEALG